MKKFELGQMTTYEEKEINKKRVFKQVHFDTLTTDEMLSGQRFSIHAMFLLYISLDTFDFLFIII